MTRVYPFCTTHVMYHYNTGEYCVLLSCILMSPIHRPIFDVHNTVSNLCSFHSVLVLSLRSNNIIVCSRRAKVLNTPRGGGDSAAPRLAGSKFIQSNTILRNRKKSYCKFVHALEEPVLYDNHYDYCVRT